MLKKMSDVAREIEQTLNRTSYREQTALAQAILRANRIFVSGAGRSGLMARCFAMRLMHMGFQAYMVGEVVTPSIGAGDLLIVASGSGATGSLARIAEKAISLGAELAVVTICPEGIIGSMASVTVKIDAPVCKTGDQQQPGSIQPMANLFEQCLLICLDYVEMILMDMTGVTSEQMYRRHANLE